MIDLRIVRDQPDLVRESQRARGEDPAAVDRLVSADVRRRTAAAAFDRLRAEQKAAGKTISAATGDERAALLELAKRLAAEVKAADAERAEADAALREAWLAVSNLVDEAAPVGGEDDFAVLETVGEPAEYGFEVRDHAELGEILGAIDIARGAKVSGARFYFLTGVGARLELALVNMAMARAVDAGITPMVAPALVRPSAMEGTGFLGAHASEVYRLAEDDLYLVGTAEVPLAAYHSDETLEVLPRRYAGFSPCFRREAGSYGKDTKGVFRVHWFDKVEMFSFCAESAAAEEHQRLLGWEKEFLADLELPYRVIDVATGDLGASAVRKFDCEAWFPSQGRYRELTSASNCTTFQARRLGVRTRDEGRTTPVATLNGTLCAVTRTIAALLENHQRADGSVRVPEALRPYLGGMSELTPVDKPVSA